MDMNRREFLKASGAFAALALSGLKVDALGKRNKPTVDFSRFRGFNLLAKFMTHGPKRRFEEEDFEIMADWGFNFARIPMSYWHWASKDDWYNINEEELKDIDEVVELGKQYNIHINLNLLSAYSSPFWNLHFDQCKRIRPGELIKRPKYI